MAINITDELHAATTKGKVASAKEVYLAGDIENLQQIGDKTHQLEDSIKKIAVTGGASTAAAVTFNNAASGMTAVNAQGAIEELNTKNKMQDTELSKKANTADVTSQIQTEHERVNLELGKKLNKDDIIGIKNKTFDIGYYTSSKIGNVISMQTSSSYKCTLIEVCPDMEFVIKGMGKSDARLWFTCDEEKKIVRHSEENLDSQDGIIVKIEQGEYYLGVNIYDTESALMLDNLSYKGSLFDYINDYNRLDNSLSFDIDTDNGFVSVYKKGKKQCDLTLNGKIVKLSGIGTDYNTIAPNKGDIGYVSNKKILVMRKSSQWDYEIIPFYKGALYLYNNNLYAYNGDALYDFLLESQAVVSIKSEFGKRIESLTSEFKSTSNVTSGSTLNIEYDVNFKRGEKIRIEITGDNVAPNVSIKFNDETIGEWAINSVHEIELENDVNKITALKYSVLSDGSVTLKVVKIGLLTDVEDVVNKANLFDGKITNIENEIGVTFGSSWNVYTTTYNLKKIYRNIRKGKIVQINIDNSLFVEKKEVVIKSDGFDTIRKIVPFSAFEVKLTKDASYFSAEIGQSSISSDGEIYFGIEVIGDNTRKRFGKINRPIITIIDDDTSSETSIKAFHDACVANKIKGCYAVLTKTLSSNQNKLELLKQYEREGFQMLLHSYTQQEFQRTGETRNEVLMEEDFVKGIVDMQNYNFANFRFWVTPYGVSDSFAQKLAKKWGFNALISISQNDYIRKDNTNQRFALPRPGFNSTDESGSVSFEKLKILINKAAEDGGWVLVGTHIYDGWTEELISTRFAELVRYAKEKGLEFVTFGEGYNQFEPVFKYYETY